MSNRRREASPEVSRAEAVRLRRREQAQKRVSTSSVLATRPLPPITSRGESAYLSPRSRTVPNTKRQFQAALSMPGIEVRMPDVRFTSAAVKSRLVSGLLTLLLGAALYLVATLPEFRVAAAQVSGNQRISPEEINSVLNSTGQSIFMLKGSDLETRLRLNFPDLESAHVTIGLPNVVAVSVVERQPVLLWQQGNGYTFIDTNGVAFRPRGGTDNVIAVAALASPPASTQTQVDPLSPAPFISPELVKAIQTLAPQVPSGSTMEYDPKYGLGWSDSRGWKAFFGNSTQDMAVKLQVYQSLVESLTQKGIVPAFISVQYANAPYYRISQ
jgi:POTRA domain, FtsQ-type/Cell division protein FtsQ